MIGSMKAVSLMFASSRAAAPSKSRMVIRWFCTGHRTMRLIANTPMLIASIDR